MNICYFPGQCIGKSCTCVLSMNMINPNWFFNMNELPGNLKCIAPGIAGRLSSQILVYLDNSYTVAGKPEKIFLAAFVPSRRCNRIAVLRQRYLCEVYRRAAFDKILVIHIVTGQIHAVQILELFNISHNMRLVIFRCYKADMGRQGRILFSISFISFSDFGSYST